MIDFLSPQVLLTILFLTIVFLHISKKNFDFAIAYSVQSFIIVLTLVNAYLESSDVSLIFIALLTLVVKVILAPVFFIRLIKKNALKFSVSTYLNMPLTLLVIAILTAVAHSKKMLLLTSIAPVNQAVLALALSALALSLFLMVNRKGALSQIIGILSFENSIVAFALFAGLEQSLGLQVGIIFDMFVWLVIATTFMSMIYKHFGSLNVTSMQHLKD